MYNIKKIEKYPLTQNYLMALYHYVNGNEEEFNNSYLLCNEVYNSLSPIKQKYAENRLNILNTIKDGDLTLEKLIEFEDQMPGKPIFQKQFYNILLKKETMDLPQKKYIKMIPAHLLIMEFITLICTMFSFFIATLIIANMPDIRAFGGSGMYKYSWIFLLFIPIAIFNICLEFYLKKKNSGHIFSVIVSSICILLMIGVFLVSNIYKNTKSNLNKIESNLVHVELPKNLDYENDYRNYATITYAKIIDEDEKQAFESTLSDSKYWDKNLKNSIFYALPQEVRYQIVKEKYDYFLSFNNTSKSYNLSWLFSGENNILIIAYDIEESKFMMINDYVIIM